VVIAAGQASPLRAAQTPPLPMPPQSVSSPQPPPSTGITPAEGQAEKKESVPASAADAGLSPTPGKQESLVTVDWVGPSAAQVDQRTEYTLLVRNISPLALHKVRVNVRAGAGLVTGNSTPAATTEGEFLVWQLGTLLPRQEKSLQLELVAKNKGEVTPQAWVTFIGAASSSLRIRVSEPKLALKVTAPARVVAGDPANFMLTVSNTSESLAGQVKVRVNLSEGLEHVRGRTVDFEVGDLGVGESRTVQLVCLARAGGEQTCSVAAESAGSVKAQDRATVNVVVPTLDVDLTGPALRYVDRKATYTLRVANKGEVPASNVTVSEAIPAGFKFVSASDGGRPTASTATVSWFLGEMAPKQTREVQCELIAIKAGEHRHRATACTERGFKVEIARELVTRVEDFSALGLEIGHADDAIEVGKDTTYEVVVTNSGSKMETDVKLLCAIPEKMEFKSARGPSRYHREGSVIVFEPVQRLAPRGDVVYQVTVKALTPGDVRFKALVTSTNLVEPVIKTEAMRIYSDRP